MSATLRLTAAQAIVRYLAAQRAVTDDGVVPLFGGVFAIFGHGNVAGLGEALEPLARRLPDLSRPQRAGDGARGDRLRQGAHARRRMMAAPRPSDRARPTWSPPPPLAHVNRLPVLLLPGDVFASRAPDPVLQQVEDFGDPTVSANDCLRPVSRYFDRIIARSSCSPACRAARRRADRRRR